MTQQANGDAETIEKNDTNRKKRKTPHPTKRDMMQQANGDAETIEKTGPDAGRKLLKDRAYTEILRRILDGELQPGTFLAERTLADRLGMSKTPVRAAIGRLEAEGFVTVSPQQGIVVRELSIREIVDHFDIRMALETFVVRRLSGKLTEGQEEELRKNLADQEREVEAGNVPDYYELDAEFHMLLCGFLDNQEIVRVMEHQRLKLHRIIIRVLHQDIGRLRPGFEEHVAIANAVIENEAEIAAALIHRHLEFGKRILVGL